jgi:putative ABC transport system permease protein
MNFSDLISETFHSLTSNKGRSGLTILGIVIGIASVIAMVGIGEGSKVAIETSIQAAGSNLLTISPSAAGQAGAGARSFGMNVESLTRTDAEELSALPLISGVAA